MIPCIVGSPELETDGKVTSRSGDENPFTGMGNIHSGHDENLFTNGSVDQNSVAYLHGGPALSVALPHLLKLASIAYLHGGPALSVALPHLLKLASKGLSCNFK